MNLGFSRVLAIVFGTALPLLGMVRNLMLEPDAGSFFPDLVAGAFLLVGAWRVGVSPHSGQRFLAAAWGLTIGLFYADLHDQIEAMYRPVIVEAPTPFIPPELAIAASGFGLLMAILGLIGCLRSTRKS